MKLFVSLVLASTLALKLAEGVAADLDQECDVLFGCVDDNAECVDRNGDGSTHCHCTADFSGVDGQCKADNGQDCTSNDDCASDNCERMSDGTEKCAPKRAGQFCESNKDCGQKAKCTVMEDGVGKCECARAASIPVSVILIMAALVTSGFWWSPASFP